MKEIEIIKFKAPWLKDLQIIDIICMRGYNLTGCKFWVTFVGSKGYLSMMEVDCEGPQSRNNRIDIYKLRNKDGSFKKTVMVNIYHSEQNGVRVSTGKDEPRVIEKEEKKKLIEVNVSNNRDIDDLPF